MSKEFKFDWQFSFKRDKYQWILTENYKGKSKDGSEKMQSRDTYHASLEQVCQNIIDRSSGDFSSIEELLSLYRMNISFLTADVESKVASHD